MSIPLTIIDGTFTRDENMLEYTVKEDGGDEWDIRAHACESDGKFHGVVIIKGHARQPYAEGDTIDDMALKLAEQVITIKRHLEEGEERAEQVRAHSRIIVDERERNMEPYHGFTSSVSPEIVGGKQWTDPLTGHLWTYAGDYGWFDEDTLEDRYASLGMDEQRAVHAGSGTCHAPGHFGLARTVRRGLDEGLTPEQITRQAEKENGYHARIQAAEMIRALRNQDSQQ